jgi:hypothetical protein
VGVEEAVGGSPLALREPPGEPRHGREDRQPDPDEAEDGADEGAAEDHDEVREPVRDAEQHVEERPPGVPAGATAARSPAGATAAGELSTVTSPLPLNAWTVYGASSAIMSPRTCSVSASLLASTR